jgi:septal ring-binding cell division protein DamX
VTSASNATDRYRKGAESFRAGDLAGAAAIWEALLAEEHRGGFTVQLLTACQPDTVRDAQRSIAAQDVYLVTKKVNGRPCYRVCAGVYESREAAARALAGLPGHLRIGGASVRPVADVLNRDR